MWITEIFNTIGGISKLVGYINASILESQFGEVSMSISSIVSSDGTELTIGVEGRFDFSSHQGFRRAYEGQSSKADSYVVDLQNTTYLDSSALGMLLLLKDYAGGDNAKIDIKNCNDDVRKILAISNFEQLFNIC